MNIEFDVTLQCNFSCLNCNRHSNFNDLSSPLTGGKKNQVGMDLYDSTDISIQKTKEFIDYSKGEDNKNNIEVDLMRIRSFPFNLDVWEFIENHDLIYVIEQNRDSQMRTLIMAEGGISAEKLRSLVWFNGDPIQANFIAKKIYERESQQALIT